LSRRGGRGQRWPIGGEKGGARAEGGNTVYPYLEGKGNNEYLEGSSQNLHGEGGKRGGGKGNIKVTIHLIILSGEFF